MEIRKTDNTAFKANMFARGKTSVETAILAVEGGFIKDKAAVKEGGVYRVADGFLALDPETLAAKLIKLLKEARESFLIGSPEGNKVTEKFNQALVETVNDPSTILIA